MSMYIGLLVLNNTISNITVIFQLSYLVDLEDYPEHTTCLRQDSDKLQCYTSLNSFVIYVSKDCKDRDKSSGFLIRF
jgi:hypothetical protein